MGDACDLGGTLSGSEIMSGSCPGPINAHYRWQKGWFTVQALTTDILPATINYNERTPTVYRRQVSTSPDEYFYAESKRFLSFNRFLPGHSLGHDGGLLVWHVQSNSTVYLERADNVADGDYYNGEPNDIYPGPTVNNSRFHPLSTPNSNKLDGTRSGFGLTNISVISGIGVSANAYINYLVSDNTDATAFNNSRKLIRDSGGKYLLVYESGGEIYYQYSTNGINTWLGLIRLSTGNGNNKYPSITGTSSKQFVVWQRYTGYSGGQHRYDTYIARNTGSGWTTMTITNLCNLSFSTQTNPLPVVTYKNPSGTQRLLVCVRSNTGIRYCYSDNDGSTWSAATNLPSTTSDSKTPSLSMGPTTPSATVYASYDEEGAVFFNTYNTSWGSAENVASGSGCVENKNASVEVDGNSGKNVAWEGKKISNNKYDIVHKRKTSSWGVPTYFEPGSGNEFHRPSITGLAGIKRAIVWHDKYGCIYRAYTADGYNWSTFAISDGWLQHPNLSAGTTTAKYVFTGGSASPYQIYLSSETLPLSGLAKPMLASAAEEHLKMLPCPQRYQRAVMVADTTSASLLWVQWGDILIKTKNDTEVPMSFVALPDSMPQLTAETALNFLTTTSLLLPADTDSLEWEQELYGCKLEQLVTSGTSDLVVEIQLVAAKTGLPLAVLNRATLPVSLAETRLAGTVMSDISAYQGREVMLKVNVIAIAQNIPGITSNAGEVFIIENPFLNISQPKAQPPVATETSLPVAYQLEQNYPNPFNAETTIGYQLPEASPVILNIYNLLGQQVRKLVDKDQAAGYHIVPWDGKDTEGQDLASGIYIYRIEAGSFVASKKLALVR